jgi:hypothetical protein
VKYQYTNATSANGIVTLPSDYLRFLSVWYTGYDNATQRTKLKGIEVVNDDELAERLESQLIPVSATTPVAQWIGQGKIQLWPKTASVGEVWYLKKPNKPVFGYTRTQRVITYDPATSVQLEWDEANINKVIFKTLSLLGVNLSDDKLMEYSNLKDQTEL